MKGGKNISSSLASHSTGETRHSDIMNKHKNVLDTLGAGKNRNLHFSFRIFLKWGYICSLPYFHNTPFIKCILKRNP